MGNFAHTWSLQGSTVYLVTWWATGVDILTQGAQIDSRKSCKTPGAYSKPFPGNLVKTNLVGNFAPPPCRMVRLKTRLYQEHSIACISIGKMILRFILDDMLTEGKYNTTHLLSSYNGRNSCSLKSPFQKTSH